jgi:hypothetical protein
LKKTKKAEGKEMTSKEEKFLAGLIKLEDLVRL